MTEIECGDGSDALKNATINKSSGPNSSKTAIVNELVAGLKVPIKVIKGVKETVIKNGLSLSGNIKDILPKLLGEDAEFSIQDNKVMIVPKNEVASAEEAVVVSPQTGLLGSPIRNKDGEGVEFTCLINPSISVNHKVQIISNEVEGFYKPRKISFTGDNKQGQWVYRVEAIEV